MNKLGFGFLRLPTVAGSDEIDLDALNRMVDVYLDHGKRYFDTAYTYLGGRSEWALRECAVKRHPRERLILADKLPGYQMRGRADCERCFAEQLERCGVAYFDVYMLHWLNDANYRIARQQRQFDFLRDLKAAGRARRIGFSYHDTAELLDEILTEHPEVDYVQLQVNYLDWDSASIQSRRCCEVAKRHGKRVIVMEPVKGGALAALPPEAETLLRTLSPSESAASFALRFAESIPEVEIVLSGMSAMDQLLDNLRDHAPLGEEEKRTLAQAAEVINRATAIPCTGCGYCAGGCPKRVAIPQYFKLYNEYARNPRDGWKIAPAYRRLAADHGRAADCVGCGQCEAHCPQKLPITAHLRNVSETFD